MDRPAVQRVPWQPLEGARLGTARSVAEFASSVQKLQLNKERPDRKAIWPF